MIYRLTLRAAVFIFALGLLAFTLARVSGVKYAFKEPTTKLSNAATDVDVTYDLPYSGRILPGHPLWEIRVLRDRALMRLAADDYARAERSLSLADVRLSIAYRLWERGEYSDSVTVALKGAGYLEYANELSSEIEDDTDRLNFLRLVCYSSLKYREIMEMMLAEGSDDARPTIHKIMEIPKNTYSHCSSDIVLKGGIPPENPF